MKQILKYLGYFLLAALIMIQFFRPQKNIAARAAVATNDIRNSYFVPADLQDILQTSCYDCHSNNTVYPWYANIQPIAWWLADHINEGKKELNFSEFTSYNLRRKYKKLEDIVKQVKEDEMPLVSYTVIHRNASLSPGQQQRVIYWAQAIRDTMKAIYPEDSLIRKDNPPVEFEPTMTSSI